MLNRSTAADTGTIERGLESKKKIRVGTEIYNDIVQALYEEAAALDERRFEDWVAMLADDLVYTAPIRLTRTGPQGNRDVMRTMMHFSENLGSIRQRIGRMDKQCAWAEDPPSRTRRFVTNVRVAEGAVAGEYEVVSYLFLVRSRGASPLTEEVTAARRDVWRGDGEYQLAKREIIVDQSVLSMSNFAIFL